MQRLPLRWNKTEKQQWNMPPARARAALHGSSSRTIRRRRSSGWCTVRRGLTLRREDVRRYNDGVLPENLIFCDCGVLAEASAEEWVRLASRKPDYLIFRLLP